MGEFMGGLVGIAFFAMIGAAIYFEHLQKMAKLNAKQVVGITPELRAELDALKSQIAEVSARASDFDLSFDAALSRLEQRLNGASPTRTVVAQEVAVQSIGSGR